MSNLEIEIKFHLENPGAIREAIISLGATSPGRLFETNHILDDPGRTLFKRNALLRLRQDERTLLTFKSPAPDTDRFKQYAIGDIVDGSTDLSKSITLTNCLFEAGVCGFFEVIGFPPKTGKFFLSALPCLTKGLA